MNPSLDDEYTDTGDDLIDEDDDVLIEVTASEGWTGIGRLAGVW